MVSSSTALLSAARLPCLGCPFGGYDGTTLDAAPLSCQAAAPSILLLTLYVPVRLLVSASRTAESPHARADRTTPSVSVPAVVGGGC